MTYKRTLFTSAASYRVLQSFTSASFFFSEGEILIFVRDYYDFYDSAFIYEFRSPETGELKQWWLAHDETAERWQSYFEPI